MTGPVKTERGKLLALPQPSAQNSAERETKSRILRDMLVPYIMFLYFPYNCFSFRNDFLNFLKLFRQELEIMYVSSFLHAPRK